MAGYSEDGLKHGIERCHINIGVLKEAIQRERQTIKEYENMMRDLAAHREQVAARDKLAGEYPNGKIKAERVP